MPRPYPATSSSWGLTEVKYKHRVGKAAEKRKKKREREIEIRGKMGK